MQNRSKLVVMSAMLAAVWCAAPQAQTTQPNVGNAAASGATPSPTNTHAYLGVNRGSAGTGAAGRPQLS